MVKALPILRAASLGGLLVTLAGGALAQATPPSPFRAPEREEPAPAELAVAVEPEPAPAPVAAEKVDPDETPLERARRQVVVLQRGGKPIALGSVLAGDGRILTALSPLGHGNNVDARFADGKLTRVRVVHSDRGWDLALVAPAANRADVGLRASRASAVAKGAKLTSFAPGAKGVASVSVRVKGERTLVGGDNAQLEHALELESKHKTSELGSAVIDEKGDVVGVIAQACAPVADKPCSTTPYAAPVGAIKAFLRAAPGANVQAAPPFGVRGMAHDAGTVKGVRVLSVSPRSRLARAGLRPGADTIVAVNGRPVTTPEALADALSASPGPVELLVFDGNRYREATASPSVPERRGFRRIDRWKRPPGWRPRPRPHDPGY